MSEEYCGYKEIELSNEDLAAFYSSENNVDYGCKTNEYLVMKNMDGEVVDKYRWDGTEFVKLNTKPISSKFGGKVAPRNLQQELALDMIHNDDITVKMIAGKFGSGKTYLYSAAAVELLEKNKYEKIIFVRNNIEVKNTKPLGFLPGEQDEKIWPFAAPLADHVGGEYQLEMMIRNRKVELAHLGFIRGRDIKNSIIFCTEAENLTKEHIQLLISRVGDGSTIWFDGDLKQRDAEVFVKNSGMELAINRLAGHPRFGYVKLLKSERSETAAMADLLD